LYFRHRLLNESPKMDYIADSDFLYQCAHRWRPARYDEILYL
jgi:hypothetical protein